MVFDSICYKHVPDARRRKLDVKSEPMILIGYHKTRVYRIFNLINDKTVMSQDIMINDKYLWDWNLGDATNNPLMIYAFYDESSEHEEILANDVPVTV